MTCFWTTIDAILRRFPFVAGTLPGHTSYNISPGTHQAPRTAHTLFVRGVRLPFGSRLFAVGGRVGPMHRVRGSEETRYGV